MLFVGQEEEPLPKPLVAVGTSAAFAFGKVSFSVRLAWGREGCLAPDDCGCGGGVEVPSDFDERCQWKMERLDHET